MRSVHVHRMRRSLEEVSSLDSYDSMRAYGGGCKSVRTFLKAPIHLWIIESLLIKSQIPPQLAKLQIVEWYTFLYKNLGLGG